MTKTMEQYYIWQWEEVRGKAPFFGWEKLELNASLNDIDEVKHS